MIHDAMAMMIHDGTAKTECQRVRAVRHDNKTTHSIPIAAKSNPMIKPYMDHSR